MPHGSRHMLGSQQTGGGSSRAHQSPAKFLIPRAGHILCTGSIRFLPKFLFVLHLL